MMAGWSKVEESGEGISSNETNDNNFAEEQRKHVNLLEDEPGRKPISPKRLQVTTVGVEGSTNSIRTPWCFTEPERRQGKTQNLILKTFYTHPHLLKSCLWRFQNHEYLAPSLPLVVVGIVIPWTTAITFIRCSCSGVRSARSVRAAVDGSCTWLVILLYNCRMLCGVPNLPITRAVRSAVRLLLCTCINWNESKLFLINFSTSNYSEFILIYIYKISYFINIIFWSRKLL